MKLKYIKPSFQYMIDSILEFQKAEQSEFFRESLYYFYPQFDKEQMNTLSFVGQEDYLKDNLFRTYKDNEAVFNEKVELYQSFWDKNEKVIVEVFEDIFQIDLSEKFNDIKAFITLNPICPRYLDSNSFDVFYLNSVSGALGISLHEIVHFVWFKKWNEYFHDSKNEYDIPHLKWVFSEMVVDQILKDSRIRGLNPYSTQSAYEYFYRIKIEDKNLMDILSELYRENSITDFMEKGFKFCQENEQIIREAMC